MQKMPVDTYTTFEGDIVEIYSNLPAALERREALACVSPKLSYTNQAFEIRYQPKTEARL